MGFQRGGKSKKFDLKMKTLILLLSTSLVFGGLSLNKREVANRQSHTSGPYCYDHKDYQCRKKPKHETHEECHVEYEVVVEYEEHQYDNGHYRKRAAQAPVGIQAPDPKG